MVKAKKYYQSKLVKLFPAWVAAVTVGDYIFFRGFPSASLIRHEEAHVIQYRRYGILGFLVRYTYYSIRYGYYNNPLEVEARQYANKANTVYK